MARVKLTQHIPRMRCEFHYETASALQHLMLAQLQHAKKEKEACGSSILLECFETLTPFFESLTEYVTKHQ